MKKRLCALLPAAFGRSNSLGSWIRKGLAPAQVAKRTRTSLLRFEALEPRLLLSGDAFTAAQATTVQAGVQELADWGAALDGYGALAQALPVYTQATADAPKVYSTVGAKVDFGTLLQSKLAAPVAAYFAGDATPTLGELSTALNQVAGVTTTPGIVDGTQITLNVQLDTTIAATSGKVDLDSAASGIRATTALDVGAEAVFNFTLGLDLTAGLAPAESFFIEVPNNGLTLSASGHNATVSAFDGSVGFLDVKLGDGTAASHVDLSATLPVSFTNSEVNADGRITSAELQSTSLAEMVTLTPTSSLLAALPVSATLGSFKPIGGYASSDNNLFDAVAPTVTLTNFDELLNFNNIGAQEALGVASSLGGWLNSLQSQDLLSFDLPFVKGADLSKLDDFGTVFASVVGGLQKPVTVGPPQVLPNTPDFTSAQDLGAKLVTLLPGTTADYNAATHELTYHVKLATTGSGSATIAVPDVGALHDVTSNSPVTLAETGSFDFTFGVNLSTHAGAPDQHRTADDVFVKDGALQADVTTSAPLVIANGFYGFADLTITSGTLSGAAELQRGLQGSGGATQIDLTDLLKGVSKTPTPLATAALLSKSSTLVLDGISGPVSVIGALSGDPSLTLTQGTADPVTAVTLTPNSDFAPLQQYASMKASDVIAALQEADAYLARVAKLGALGAPLPLLGIGEGTLVQLASTLDKAITELEATPPQSLSAVGTAVGNALNAAVTGAVTVTFKLDPSDPHALKMGLSFSNDVSLLRHLQMDLAGLSALDATPPPVADQLALSDVSPAKLHASAHADFALDLGIDLSTPATPTPFIYDSSKLTLTAKFAETALDLALVAGPLQVAVKNGSTRLDEDGNPVTDDAATFIVTVKDPGTVAANHRVTPGELAAISGAADVGIAVTGQAHATLPTFFPDASTPQGNLQLDIADLGAYLAGTAGSVALTLPGFGTQAAQAAGNRSVVADGLDALLKTLQQALNQDVFGSSELPLVGDALSKLGTGVLDDFRNKFVNDFRTALGSTPDDAKVVAALQSVLTSLGDLQGAVTQLANGEFDLTLNVPIFHASNSIAFDLGLPALGLSSDAKVNADIGFTWHVDFGVSDTDGFFLDTAAKNELNLALNLTIPNSTATGHLGFLQLDITDKGSHLSGDIAVDISAPGDKLTLGAITAGPDLGALLAPELSLDAKIDLGTEISFGGNTMFPSFGAEFILDWSIDSASPETATTAPMIEFKDVTLHLGKFFSDFAEPILKTVQDILGPVQPFEDFLTKPIPVLSDVPLLPDLLGGDFDGKSGVSLLDLGHKYGNADATDFLEQVFKLNDIVTKIGAVSGAGNIGVDLGDFVVSDGKGSGAVTDLRTASADDLLKVKIPGTPFSADQLLSAAGLDPNDPAVQTVVGALDSIIKSGVGGNDSGIGASDASINPIAFPILDDPSSAFGLLLGHDVSLFTFDMQPIDIGDSFDTFIRLLGPLGVRFSGGLNAHIDFAFGYDTRGLTDTLKTGNPTSLLDGFYVSDTASPDGTGPDIPEVSLTGSIYAAAALNVFVAEAGVGGGVFANVDFNLEDSKDGDGKIRLPQLRDEFLQGPLCIFDITGQLTASLNAYVKVGFDTPVGFVTVYSDSYDIASATLLSFAHDCSSVPTLASLDAGGNLTLNIGPHAGDRQSGADGNLAEVISVTQALDQDGHAIDGAVDVIGFGQTQRYGNKGTKVSHITADGGGGNDVITIDQSVHIDATLSGGEGDDQIVGGSGSDTIHGGNGNDVLSGGAGNDFIYGEGDNDLIFGNAGADFLDGGAGSDHIYGGNGVDQYDASGKPIGNEGDLGDVIFGGDGNDSLYGNLGDDKISGGPGDDQIFGGDGNDLLVGGDGHDLIEGNLGADYLYGDRDLVFNFLLATWEASAPTAYVGNDSLFGDARTPNHPGSTDGGDFLYGDLGNDYLVGNDGDDELHGGDGNDALIGGAGNDKLYGDAGNDTMSGGIGDDQLYGGDGNDLMFGDDRTAFGPETVLAAGQTDTDFMEGDKGDDTMYGGAGDDHMIGGTSSQLAADQDATGKDYLAGDSGNDILLGDNGYFGSVHLIGGSGDDTLIGGSGDDLIYGQGGNDTAEGGLGNDTIYGNAGDDVLRGQENDDTIEGGSGSDTIYGGDGNDNLIGGASSIAGLDGGVDVGDLIIGGAGNDVILGDNGTIDALTRAVVTNPDGGAGIDFLFGGSGDDIVFGGGFGDFIFGDVAGGTGLDILVGDQGTSSATAIVAQHSSFADSGGADIISGSGGDDIILGGDAGDTLGGDAGSDIIVGDDGRVTLQAGVVVKVETLTSGFGGVDTISGGADADIALGGEAGDVIDGGSGSDVLLGDNGLVDFLYNGDTDPNTLDLIRSYADGSGAADTISGGSGGDVVVGGTGGDTIYGDSATPSAAGGDGADILIGDNADIALQGSAGALTVAVAGRLAGTAVARIATTDTTETTGGADTISGNAGGDVILGGVNGIGGVDTLYGDAVSPSTALDGADVILGDNGELDFAGPGGTLSLIRSALDTLGGTDVISGNAGGDVAIGGTGGDTIYGDDASASAGTADGGDILLGDNADIVLVDPAAHGGITGDAIGILGGGVAKIATTDVDTTTGGSDTIVGNAGGDIIMGGVLAETIYGDAATPGAYDGNDVILGDNGRVEWLYTGDPAYASIESGMPGAFDNTLATLDLITTDVPASHPGGRDTIYGDAGNDVAFGGEYADTLFGDTGTLADSGGGNDILFGDHGRLYPHRSLLANFASRNFFATDTGNGSAAEGDRIWGESGDDVILGEQGDDRLFGGSGNDDIIGGSNVAGAVDELAVTNVAATQAGAAINDLIDGGSGDDAIAGDNAIIWRRTSIASARFQVLPGTVIYSSTDTTDTVNVTGTPQNDPNGVVGRDITLLDHSDTTPVGLYGNDVIAGGAGNDLAFGELGNDVIQGDGMLATAPIAGAVSVRLDVADSGPAPKTDGTLYFNVPEAATDGDDYIEGNGGSDLLYGGLGQDDLIGGSSGMFGLTTAAQRPDAGDTIYGGAATPAQLARDSAGSSGVDSHARDADVIVGDNGNIYRLVGINGVSTGHYLSFNYDASSGTDVRGSLRIIPRAVQLLDYTAGGPDYNPAQAALDRGGDDVIHGEGGDDIAYGMKGNDVLYGEGQNDDLIGGYGNDWISGGTGDDGVLGDDGRLKTSRNGLTEPLYGVNTATAQQTISTPGNIQLATINVTGTLTKSADLTPFSNDPSWTAATDEFGGITRRNADDIIFGGLGNDFLHGGSGDDAISGAEALVLSWAPVYDPATHVQTGVIEVDYTHPVNLGYMLAFNPVDVDGKHANLTRAGEFALYNEYDPLRKIVVNGGDYFLNFDANDPAAPASTLDASKKTDGDDKIFGDLGNDWLVGGTGRDDLYGGFGNDLLNADDDLGTNNGANDQPDTSASYEDRAFGGAGRDVLIANTGGDRLIDWTGEFNSYLVPFAPFGMATVSRTLQPHLMDFLYALSAADGADPTRAADKASLGADPSRNGEPWGELGLVLQTDAAWSDQHGGPADPQAGNLPGGQRDVLRSANFDNGNPQGFVPASGNWSVVNGHYQVAPPAGGGDAVSLFNEADTVIPDYFEMQATINAVKPVAGTKANAFLIFDYQSGTDFKYAGIDISSNKLIIGHRTASGWAVDASTNAQLKAGVDYVVLLSVNVSSVTVTIGTTTISYAFAPRTDSLGVKHAINDGIVGVGGNNAAAQIDNVIVQAPPGAITLDKSVDFGSTSPASALFGTPASGTWQTTSDSRFLATASSTGTPAVDLIGIGVSPGALVDITTTLRTYAQGGVVFDYQGPSLYKFAILSADARQIVIGHRTPAGVVTDASFAVSISAGVDYKVEVKIRGGLVNVALNGAVVASKLYNETVTIGGYGLLGAKGTTSSQTSFDSVEVKTDDAVYASAPAQLTAAAAPAQPVDPRAANTPTATELNALVAEAKRRWADWGLQSAALARLDTIDVKIADLDGLILGEEQGSTITIDTDAAGYGWFIDRSPGSDTEFDLSGQTLIATHGPAVGRIDLLSVITHELGHAAGLQHEPYGPLEVTLATGVRDVPIIHIALPEESGSRVAADISGTAPSWGGEDWYRVAPASVFATPLRTLARAGIDSRPWLEAFVNNLGTPGRLQSNAGIRLHLPIAPRLSVTDSFE
jgi:Ca2+-binding RTX toxin-like protein